MTKKDRKEHWNSKRDGKKWEEFIDLIKKDVTFVAASAYVGIAERTLRHWIEVDEDLLQEYSRAKRYMDVITSNAITSAILDKGTSKMDRAKLSVDWKKRRDKRYRDKWEQEVYGKDGEPLNKAISVEIITNEDKKHNSIPEEPTKWKEDNNQ